MGVVACTVRKTFALCILKQLGMESQSMEFSFN